MNWIPTTLPGWAWLTGGLVLVLACLAMAAWLWRSRPWRGPCPRHPVVLVHGIMGFDEIGIGSYRQTYFRAIPEHLERLGITVYRPRLPAMGSLTARAAALAEALAAIPDKRVNIIAHSMGGLDARYAISRLGCAPKVASLTTIGTPHRGTPVADLGGGLVGSLLGPLLSKVGLEAVADLGTAGARALNRSAPDVRGVHYFSVVTRVAHGGDRLHPLLKPVRTWLEGRAGPSDGLVPVSSQVWGEVLERVRADHWAQIGWSNGFDAPALYERVASHLRRRGC